MWDNGMMVRLHDQYFKSTDQCRIDKPPETKKSALTLTDVSPVFAIIGIGMLLSTFCFLVEIIFKYVIIFCVIIRSSKASRRPIPAEMQDNNETLK